MTSFTAHGKCVLAGEHTVLRGGQAVVCPLPQLTVTCHLTFEKAGIWVKKAEEILPFPDQTRLLTFFQQKGYPLTCGALLEIQMPMRMGLGGSAALAVAFAKAFHAAFQTDIFDLAWEIENLFHGTSSGMDVAGALTSQPVRYQANPRLFQPLSLGWKPSLFLSQTGEHADTRFAIARVGELRQRAPSEAYLIDTQMREASALVIEGLTDPNGAALLQKGLKLAGKCFEAWSLVTPLMQRCIQELLAHGAKAVKPTGSGLGGMLLSLWDTPPPSELGCTQVML